MREARDCGALLVEHIEETGFGSEADADPNRPGAIVRFGAPVMPNSERLGSSE